MSAPPAEPPPAALPPNAERRTLARRPAHQGAPPKSRPYGTHTTATPFVRL
jgi:hypothetical protein